MNRIIAHTCESMSEVADGAVALTVTSPPYWNAIDYETHASDKTRYYRTRSYSNGYGDYHGYLVWLESVFAEVLRVTKPGGFCSIVIGDGTRNFAKSLTTFRWAVDWVDRVGCRMFECCIYSRHGNPGAWWTQRFRGDHGYCGLCN